MQVRCPSCGAQMSLDAIIDDNAAAQALQAALEMSPVGTHVIRYIALFRPAKTKLTWPRVAALLNELLPLIKQERFERDGRVHEAPLHAWVVAIDKVIAARDSGALRVPLKSHGYLLEVVIAEAARSQGVVHSMVAASRTTDGNTAALKPLSNTAQAIARLEERKQGN
jgi:hypothetical protein